MKNSSRNDKKIYLFEPIQNRQKTVIINDQNGLASGRIFNIDREVEENDNKKRSEGEN